MKTGLRLDEYIKVLLNKRQNEEQKPKSIQERGDNFSSPVGNTSTEEIRLFTEYMEQVNLQKITEAAPSLKKNLMLKSFLKMKRNQQVEIYSSQSEDVAATLGKVTAVGRDFVMLTNLKSRIWFPYHAIVSANVPYGIPTYSNSHQNFIYDNDLRRKLVSNFGQTVSKRDALIQQFFEETLFTNLQSWKGTWVKVRTEADTYYGTIHDVAQHTLTISSLNGKKEIGIENIHCVESLRFLSFLSIFTKYFLRFRTFVKS